MADHSDEYPTIAVYRSKRFYYLIAAACCVMLSQGALRLIELLASREQALDREIRISIWLTAFILFGGAAAYAISRMDWNKAVLLVSREGISAPGIILRILPWAAIRSIKVEASGQYRLFREVVLILDDSEGARHLANPIKASRTDALRIAFDANHLQNVSADQLADAIRRYKAKFDKSVAAGEDDGKLIRSSSWTGLADD